jgi:hypothetical protein
MEGDLVAKIEVRIGGRNGPHYQFLRVSASWFLKGQTDV